MKDIYTILRVDKSKLTDEQIDECEKVNSVLKEAELLTHYVACSQLFSMLEDFIINAKEVTPEVSAVLLSKLIEIVRDYWEEEGM